MKDYLGRIKFVIQNNQYSFLDKINFFIYELSWVGIVLFIFFVLNAENFPKLLLYAVTIVFAVFIYVILFITNNHVKKYYIPYAQFKNDTAQIANYESKIQNWSKLYNPSDWLKLWKINIRLNLQIIFSVVILFILMGLFGFIQEQQLPDFLKIIVLGLILLICTIALGFIIFLLIKSVKTYFDFSLARIGGLEKSNGSFEGKYKKTYFIILFICIIIVLTIVIWAIQNSPQIIKTNYKGI